LERVPPLDLRSEPQARSAAAEVEDWARHVGIAMHVLAHGVAMGEPQYPGDVMRVNQIVEEHAAGHQTSLHPRADGERTRVSFPSGTGCRFLV